MEKRLSTMEKSQKAPKLKSTVSVADRIKKKKSHNVRKKACVKGEGGTWGHDRNNQARG